MKAKVVSFSELTTDNPTLCLSVHRVFEDCHKCQVYKSKHDKTKLKCKPRLRPETLALIELKQRTLEQLNRINKQLGED